MGNLSTERRLEIVRSKIDKIVTLIEKYNDLSISSRKIDKLTVKLNKYLEEESLLVNG